MNNKLNKGGFTLIELLVVVLIIGILSSIALPQYTKAVEKARAAEAQAWLANFVTAETTYFMARGEFASDLTSLDIGMPVNDVTKNFTIPTSATVTGKTKATIALARKDQQSMAYTLQVEMNHVADSDTITTKRECTGTAAICKAITNGRSCSGTETSWCYGTAAAS